MTYETPSASETVINWLRDHKATCVGLVVCWTTPTFFGSLCVIWDVLWFLSANISFAAYATEHALGLWWLLHIWILWGCSGGIVWLWLTIHNPFNHSKKAFKWLSLWGLTCILVGKLLLWMMGVY